MPFLTEERRMIQEQAREFTLNEVLPVANRLDPEKGDIPMDLREKMAELGYFGILIPEQYGGLGLGCSEYCLVTEELSRGWMSVASIIARGNLLIGSQEMSEEQRGRYLPRMAKGEFLGAFSMSEPNAGSDISNISCRAKKDGSGYLISGNKYWCTFADGADFMIIIARTSEAPPGKRHLGLSMFFVEKKRGELPKGVSGAPIPKIGYFGWKTFELALDGLRGLVDAGGFDARFVDAMPTALVKPFSGSAARAMLIETMKSQGVDSFPALVAATIQGSTETTFYVLA
eukprot:gene3116-4016_t